MKTNAERQELDGFEQRLLGALLTVDDERSAASPPVRTPRRGPVRRATVAVLTGVLSAGALAAAAVTVLTDPASFQPAGAVVRGEEILLKGSGCGTDEPVSFHLDGRAIGTATAAEDGTFVASLPIPASTIPGSHRLTASCSSLDGTTLTQDAAIEVLAAAEPLGPSFAIGGVLPAGSSTRAKGSGCAGSTDVRLAIEGVEGGANVTAGSEGSFFADVRVPVSTEPGTYPITATCEGADGEPLVQATQLTVLAPGSEAAPSEEKPTLGDVPSSRA